MDTSELYVKMCDCPEIQEHEFDCMPNFHFAYNFDETWHIHHDVLGGQGDKKIWLPRQDQIQEMMLNDVDYERFALGIDDEETIFELLFTRLIKIYSSGVFANIQFHSGEQLWLAFYMSEKHQKFWSKDGWEDEKDNSR